MPRLTMLLFVVLAGCNKTQPQGTGEANSTPSASSAAAIASSAASQGAAAPSPEVGPWYEGSWKGKSAAVRRVSTTTTKEGAPAAWEKDEGKKLSGPVDLEVSVARDGLVTGSVKGALGELGVHGRVDGEELRANLSSSGDDPSAIQNGTLVLVRDADALKGQLSAATGDALVLRQCDLVLQKGAR